MRTRRSSPLLACLSALLAAALLVGCAVPPGLNQRPAFLHGPVRTTTYDGVSDDLLTAGLGKTGLASPTVPGYANPLAPTAAELRRHAIYNNYRALSDITAAGGYGTFFGPNVDANGVPGTGEGKIAGTESLAYSDDGSGRWNVTLMVQIPASFDPRRPCIAATASSGSRGIYGPIGVGEWGLKRGCAVVYTDKGTHSSPHDLATDTVPLIDGTRSPRHAAGRAAAFDAGLSDAEIAAFNASHPNRLAFKHAHSRHNPEKDWGRFMLQSIEFAFYVLNERYGEAAPGGGRLRTLLPGNTLVIATGLSNGGGTALAAAELDTLGLIDGIAISEPALQMPAQPVVNIRRGGSLLPVTGRPLYDHMTYGNLYQLCATQAPALSDAPALALVPAPIAANRCASLRAKGLLSSSSLAEQATESLQKLRDYGWEPETDYLVPSHVATEVVTATSVGYASAYSRARVSDRLCDFSYTATDASGTVIPMPPAALATSFATGTGTPPSSGVQIINDASPGGPLRSLLSVSPSTGAADGNVDGATCLRQLLTGTGPAAFALRQGIDEARRNGNLRGKPALIVHGRSDAFILVNHHSRPYTALNKLVEGPRSRLSYIEVENAQHYDAFAYLLPGFDTRSVPLHLYLIRASDAMWSHLTTGSPLPTSQVVRAVPRGGAPGAAPPLAPANVPPILTTPLPANGITYSAGTINVPD